ncbi:MAG: C40 family peptidase [Gammaproteobacteria bacterium]
MRTPIPNLISVGCLCAVITACAPWPVRPQPYVNNPVESKRAADIVRLATAELGTPYVYGGDTPRGFDCSGLVYYVFRHAGVAVPRSANGQLYASHPVDYRNIQPGDLVFFEIAGDAQMHVGIYVGKGEFVHAPETGQSVSYARLDNPYWKSRFVGIGRF